jgi:hypothetical protein
MATKNIKTDHLYDYFFLLRDINKQAKQILSSLIDHPKGYYGEIQDLDSLKNLIINRYILEKIINGIELFKKKCGFCNNKSHRYTECKENFNFIYEQEIKPKVNICCKFLDFKIKNSIINDVVKLNFYTKELIINNLGPINFCPYCGKSINVIFN